MGRSLKSTRLKGKHHVAMALLAKGRSPKDVAAQMGVVVDTIYQWQKWPEFQEAQNDYIISLAREELDRGLQDAIVDMHESTRSVVRWMTAVVIGEIELRPSDSKRWKMALDFLHHAGILDKQQVLSLESGGRDRPPSLNLTLDQRKQSVLQTGNQEILGLLEKFKDPSIQRPESHGID